MWNNILYLLIGVCSDCFSPSYWRFVTCSSFLHKWLLPHSRYRNFLKGFSILWQGTLFPLFTNEKYSFFVCCSLQQNIHVSFLRTVPPYSHQADVWVEVLKHFKYKKVIFIHSSDTDGRALLGRFQTTSQSLEDDVEIKVQVKELFLSSPYCSY